MFKTLHFYGKLHHSGLFLGCFFQMHSSNGEGITSLKAQSHCLHKDWTVGRGGAGGPSMEGPQQEGSQLLWLVNIPSRPGRVIRRAQCRMKTHAPCSKVMQKDSISTALNQVRGPPESLDRRYTARTPWNWPPHMPEFGRRRGKNKYSHKGQDTRPFNHRWVSVSLEDPALQFASIPRRPASPGPIPSPATTLSLTVASLLHLEHSSFLVPLVPSVGTVLPSSSHSSSSTNLMPPLPRAQCKYLIILYIPATPAFPSKLSSQPAFFFYDQSLPVDRGLLNQGSCCPCSLLTPEHLKQSLAYGRCRWWQNNGQIWRPPEPPNILIGLNGM